MRICGHDLLLFFLFLFFLIELNFCFASINQLYHFGDKKYDQGNLDDHAKHGKGLPGEFFEQGSMKRHILAEIGEAGIHGVEHARGASLGEMGAHLGDHQKIPLHEGSEYEVGDDDGQDLRGEPIPQIDEHYHDDGHVGDDRPGEAQHIRVHTYKKYQHRCDDVLYIVDCVHGVS